MYHTVTMVILSCSYLKLAHDFPLKEDKARLHNMVDEVPIDLTATCLSRLTVCSPGMVQRCLLGADTVGIYPFPPLSVSSLL